MEADSGASGRGERVSVGQRSRTCCVLLTDESHDLHEAVADALLIRVLVNRDAGPVCFLIAPLLVHHLAALQHKHQNIRVTEEEVRHSCPRG